MSAPGPGDTGKAGREDLPSLSVRRPVLAIVMNLLIILAGIAAFAAVEVRELPQIERPVVTVRVDYPGASPETMDADVIRPLEGAAARVSGVRSIRSASEENNGRIYIEFSPSVDVNNAANDVREAVNEVRRRLPDGVENLVVVKANDEDDPIIRLSVMGKGLSRQQLTELIENQIITSLQRVSGVAEVRMFGDRRRTLNIVIDPQRLASFGIGLDEVVAALRSARLDVPAGSLDSAEQKLIVRADASVVKEAAIEKIFIRPGIRLGEIANAFYAPAEATSLVRLNGQEVIGLGVIRRANANTIQISDGVDLAIAQLNRSLSRQVRIIKTSDDSVFVRSAVFEVLTTLALGIGIVVLVIYCFLGGLRLALIPAVTIPISLIGTLAAIWLFGFSINILTLLALVLATGLVVDDAIVVLENIERRRRQGDEPLAGAVLGTRQVFFAVIATTVTLVSVFIPIAFLPGQAGQLFLEFGFTLAIAVVISSFAALSLCPMLASRLVKNRPAASGGLGRVAARAGGLLVRGYGRSLGAVMRAPILSLGVALLAMALIGTLYASLDQELVPREDRGVLLVSLQGPDGVNLDYSDRQVKKVEALLQPLVKSGEIENVLSIVGRWDLNRGFIIAPLADWSQRRPLVEIMRELQPKFAAIPGARVGIRTPNSLSIRRSGSDLEFALTGIDYTRIAAAGDELVREIERSVPQLRAPRMEYNTTQPQLSIRIDRERAADLGIDVDRIAAVLQAMVEGTEVTEINVGSEAVPVRIESKVGAVNDTDDLRNLYVRTRAGKTVPLSSIISIRESGVAGELDRQGQRRAIQIEAELAPGVTLKEAVVAVERAAARVLPAGIGVLMLGQAETLSETSTGMLYVMAFALLVVLLVLAAQFESFLSAVVVMVTVPFGLAAAGLALWLSGTSLNVYSQIGLVMLVGLMAKNGILIVEFANQLRDEGRSPFDAALEAAEARLRPVAMTMLSTTLAAVPLLLSEGAGAEARNAIGWVVFGGLGIAILATLYVTPLVYSLLARFSKSRGSFGRRLQQEIEQAARREEGTPA